MKYLNHLYLIDLLTIDIIRLHFLTFTQYHSNHIGLYCGNKRERKPSEATESLVTGPVMGRLKLSKQN